MKKLFFFIIIQLFLLALACSGETDKENKVISTSLVPGAIGPYSQAIKSGNNIYVSGQIALDIRTGKLIEGGIKGQTHLVIQNIQKILTAAGYELKDIVQCQVFLVDLNDYEEMNEVYKQYFNEKPPARAVVQVSRIPRDALIEIMVVASKQQ